MKALLSIKPEFADKILSGEKRYEYRKQIFKQNVDTVLLYSTKPVGKIVGEFKVEKIVSGSNISLWEETKKYSGISWDFFNAYFSGRNKCFAIKIGTVKKYDTFIDPYLCFSNFVAPQSYKYIN